MTLEETAMAHHKQAKKRIRRNARRTGINHDRISRIRTFVKRVETAIARGDKAEAQGALQSAEPELHRGVSRGVMHGNTAARKLSRLHARIRAMG
jgi:small subunit ribosomal protein S20